MVLGLGLLGERIVLLQTFAVAGGPIHFDHDPDAVWWPHHACSSDLSRAKGAGLNFDAMSTSSIIGLVYLVFAGIAARFHRVYLVPSARSDFEGGNLRLREPRGGDLPRLASLSEPVTLAIAIGATIIVGSVAYIVRHESKPGPVEEDLPPERLPQPATN